MVQPPALLLRQTTMRAFGALLLLVVAGCGGSPADQVPDQVAGASSTAVTRLVVEQTTDRTQTWTLTCDPPGGDHPTPTGACGALGAAQAPFVPREDLLCTEQYGGAQTARVTGTYRGTPVDVELSRVNGCRIADWDRLGALLPGPVGVDPPK